MSSILYGIKKWFISWFCDIRIYKGGFILFGDSYYKISGKNQREIINIIEPGDVLLRRFNHYVGSVLIKGYWSHSAVYVGDDSVIHMLGDGIVKEDILIFMRCDDVCILRPINSNNISRAIDLAFEQLIIGVEYDYDFDTDTPKRFYCTEFVDYVYNYPIKNNIENKYIIPDDFLKSNYFSIVWRKDNKKDLNND